MANGKDFSWDEIHEGIVEGIKPGIIPIIIFLLIGVLVATWILSGTIPTIMVYGFKNYLSEVLLTNRFCGLCTSWCDGRELLYDCFNYGDCLSRYWTYSWIRQCDDSLVQLFQVPF